MTKMVQKIGTGLLAATLATAGLVGASTSANAAPAKKDYNPTIEKVERNQLLVRAENINRGNTIKLMVDKNGRWRVLEVWNFDNARDRDFTEVVDVGFVGKNPDKKYTLRVIDRNRNGRVVQVQDSNDDVRNNGNNGGNNTNEDPAPDGPTDDGGLGLPDLPLP